MTYNFVDPKTVLRNTKNQMLWWHKKSHYLKPCHNGLGVLNRWRFKIKIKKRL